MAYTFSINNIPANPAIAIYDLIATLIAAGWTKVMDSDGTTYSSSGTQVTSGGSGTNGLANSRAWVRMRAPAVNQGTVVNQTRELTFQRGTLATNQDWRVKYSASAGFTTSPTNQNTPSAADEVFMIGGGTDASPTFNTWFLNFAEGVSSQRIHIAAGGADEFYSFILWSHDVRGAGNRGAFFLDAMAPGSYSPLDVDPAIMYFSTAGTAFADLVATNFPTVQVTNPARARGWLGPTSSAGASLTSNNVNFGILSYPIALGTNSFTNNDDFMPCFYASTNAIFPRGVKGYSTLLMQGTVVRTNMSVADSLYTGSRDKVYFAGLWLPWSGAIPAI